MNSPRRPTLRITGDTPRRRGEDRGRQARAGITRAWQVYEELFATVAAGNARTLDVSALALRTVRAARAWAPELVEEMEGLAEGAGMPFWTIAALNARTEILAEAGALLPGAPVSASTVITVVTADRAASVELAPAGSAVVFPDDRGRLVRTNHFLAPALAAGELRGRRDPETYDRHRLLTERVRTHDGGLGPDALAGLLTAHRDDGAEICCHAPAEGRLGSRWATLATVAVDPAERCLRVHDGGPCSAGPETWTPLAAPRR